MDETSRAHKHFTFTVWRFSGREKWSVSKWEAWWRNPGRENSRRERVESQSQRVQLDASPVYGDVFYELVGGTVVEDDSSGGDLQGDFLEFLPAGFGLQRRKKQVRLEKKNEAVDWQTGQIISVSLAHFRDAEYFKQGLQPSSCSEKALQHLTRTPATLCSALQPCSPAGFHCSSGMLGNPQQLFKTETGFTITNLGPVKAERDWTAWKLQRILLLVSRNSSWSNESCVACLHSRTVC